ncbi:hypothetical protein [Brenneria goodwinii]|uniref:hypothetical protein n=1 Tax=Brenneria goodwinii TaxID=1109412 RepID=UPI0036F227E2
MENAIDNLLVQDASPLEPIQKTPVGCKTRFRHLHLDGLIVEYVVKAFMGWLLEAVASGHLYARRE